MRQMTKGENKGNRNRNCGAARRPADGFGRRLFILTALLFCFAGLASGCASEKDVDVSKLAGQLIAEVPFQDQMTQITAEVFAVLYQIDPDKVLEAAVYTSTNATAEEVAVIRAASSGDVEAVKRAVSDRLESQKSEFQDYAPKEMDKLSDPVIEVTGNCVILCVSDDNAKAKEVIKSYL